MTVLRGVEAMNLCHTDFLNTAWSLSFIILDSCVLKECFSFLSGRQSFFLAVKPGTFQISPIPASKSPYMRKPKNLLC